MNDNNFVCDFLQKIFTNSTQLISQAIRQSEGLLN